MLVLYPWTSVIEVCISSSIDLKACIALVSANPATTTLDMQSVTNLERVETGPGFVIELDEGKSL